MLSQFPKSKNQSTKTDVQRVRTVEVSMSFQSLSLTEVVARQIRYATTGFFAKWHLGNHCRNSILLTCHNPDLGSASDWLKQIYHATRPIRSTTLIWIVTHHQYGIPALVPQTSFRGETSDGIAKCRLFFHAVFSCYGNLNLSKTMTWVKSCLL